MKILVLRGKNLASIQGEFSIDFTAEPLASAGIFAITGPTGSGKSTLLDAICLALFDKIPRYKNSSDSVDIKDVSGSTITQQDSRSILRRGCIDGYSQVEFLALDGDRYCANWSVRRSRNKINGSLQRVEYSVKNLTKNREEQGTKTELTNRVIELIGLTFEQFTRAVMLAQGDFATFLKAPQKDKAELLEKLTGTEIYSRISIQIYEKNKEQESKLKQLKELVANLPILSDDELLKVQTDKAEYQKQLSELELLKAALQKSQNWLNEFKTLGIKLKEAQLANQQSVALKANAEGRFKRLALIDSVQGIRETYVALNNNKASISEQSKLKENNFSSQIALKAEIEREQKPIEQLNAELLLFEQQWSTLKDQLKEARSLDSQIKELAPNVNTSNTQLQSKKRDVAKQQELLKKASKTLEEYKQELLTIEQWFEKYSTHSSLVDNVEVIEHDLKDFLTTENDIRVTTNELLHLADKLASAQADLEKHTAEAKRLEQTMPEEIASLRRQLVDNEPCPVCGSVHHPLANTFLNSLEEETLRIQKEHVNGVIENLNEKINLIKSQQQAKNVLVDQYKKRSLNLKETLHSRLDIIPNWEAATVGADIRKLADLWKNKQQRQSLLEPDIKLEDNNIINYQRNIESLKEQIKNAEHVFNTQNERLVMLRNKRNELLDGKLADDVERQFEAKKKESQDKLQRLTQESEAKRNRLSTLEGSFKQLESNLLTLNRKLEQTDIEIENWLHTNHPDMQREQLEELLGNTPAFIQQERAELDKLSKAVDTSMALLQERQMVLDNHLKAPTRPKEEDEELLNTQMLEVTDKKTELDKSLQSCAVVLTNHENNKRKVQLYQNDIATQQAVCDNWQGLNILFGSANGQKFKVMAQGYTLDALLGYANQHLKQLSNRYLLERVSPDSLGLQIVDLDMLSEVRSVFSLSGGESFLVSLALALGLSSLSSRRMSVESLFIDEGFGSLDADSLRTAMDALERLQNQGRKIGVISHVAEMMERIPTQIQVCKSSNGQSTIQVVSNV